MNIDAQLIAIALDKPLEESKKKKKPYDSITYTTGDPDLNIAHFNKMLTGKEDSTHTSGYLNGTFKNSEAEKAASAVGTFAAASPDGASSVSAGESSGDSGASSGGEGGGMGESLEINEAKRYVRRYYMKPQNIFCSNKDEVLKALIDHEDEDCVIYTLINLGDVKDVSKLNSNDIIYYYEDGILYDKNHVRIFDYELSIKHEEERPRINPEQVSDAKLAAIYQDRMASTTNLDEENNVNSQSRPFLVYCHTNKINGKKYIGITTQRDKNRWRSGEGYKNQPVFYRAIQKYGWENFEHEILAQNLSENEAKALEQKYIAYYHTYINDPQNAGYNASIGGEANLKYSTDEQRKEAARLSHAKSKALHGDNWAENAKQKYKDNLEFFHTKNKLNYEKHKQSYLAQEKIYMAELKSKLDIIRQLNLDFPNRLSEQDKQRIINFRYCRNAEYINYLLNLFSDDEIAMAADRMTGVTDLGESVELDEDKIFVGKIGQELDLPPEIHLLDKNGVENFIDTLAPEEEFEVGYVNPQYFYKELWDYLPIYKCTEMTGYTGVDFEGSEDSEYIDKQARIDRANKEIADAKADGKPKQVGSDVDYSMQNKLVHRYNRIVPGQSGTHNTILFYPVGAPKVCYFVRLPGKTEFLKVTTEQLEKYIYAALPAIENKLRVDITKAKTHVYKTLYGQSVQEIDRETSDGQKIDPKYIHKYKRDKHAVRALYTSQIYYLKGRDMSVGQTLVEALNTEEAFNLTFDNINAYGEKLTEGKEEHKCCICGEEFEGYGNNAEPYKEGQCCNACNLKFVIPARLDQANAKEEK